MATLLVDGDNLLTIGFYGYKNYFYKGRHIGGIMCFINTIRRLFDEFKLDKIVVFWDGDESGILRKKISYHYKENRKNKNKSEEEQNSYNFQRYRIQLYLEELFVRQVEVKYCESDDCIAYYSQKSNEDIIIYSGDGDLCQLVNDRVKIYNPKFHKLFSKGDFIKYKNYEIPIENVVLIKLICGDTSDNIFGIKNLGLKRLFTIFPEVLKRPTTLEEILNKVNLLNEEEENWIYKNILTGVTKEGILGEEFYKKNKELILLDNPLVTEVGKIEIDDLIGLELDTEERSYKNAMKLMMEDGLQFYITKSDNMWLKFLNPFLKLTQKEKNKNKTRKVINIKN